MRKVREITAEEENFRLAAFRPKLAERLMKWATATLPSLYWYIGESS